MSVDDIKHRILSPESLVPAGVILAILGPIVIGTWAIAATYTEIRNDIAGVKEAMNRDNWTYAMERAIWQDFQAKNPGIKIPDVPKIRKDH